jgi:peptidoglycan/LPS O-acetylase OafA/YrhL
MPSACSHWLRVGSLARAVALVWIRAHLRIYAFGHLLRPLLRVFGRHVPRPVMATPSARITMAFPSYFLHCSWGIWVVGCLGLLAADRALPWGEQWVNWGRIIITNVVSVPGICLLLYGLMSEPTRLSRLLGSQLFNLLGKASYAFYLIHAGVLE